jgi:branched-chain amino acid transport system substrate-binding protein
MSGTSAADGIEFRNGLMLAVEEINAMGGILGRPLELHVEDTADMNAEVVSQAMQRLIDRHETPIFVNGYNFGTSMIEMEVAADNDVVFIHYNTLVSHNTKFLTDPVRYYGSFQGDPPEYYYGPCLLTYLDGLIESGQWTPANRKIALVASSAEYAIVMPMRCVISHRIAGGKSRFMTRWAFRTTNGARRWPSCARIHPP